MLPANSLKDLEEVIDSVERSRKDLLRIQCELDQIEEFVESLDRNQPALAGRER